MKKCIILANGTPPGKRIIKYFSNRGYDALICADGGANYAYNLNLLPDFIVGDLDSIEKKVLNYFKPKATIVKYARQNDTDVEKCLKHSIKLGFTETVLMGVTGNRLDHTIGNLSIILKFFHKIKIRVAAEKSILEPLSGKKILRVKKGEAISLFGFNSRTKVTAKGLKYRLNKTTLPFGIRESTSNYAINDKVELNVQGGAVFVVRDLRTALKHDNI